MGKDYLVDGARLVCVNGTGVRELHVQEERGYKENGKEKANCKDCIAETNIPYFDSCRKNEETHMCKGNMELEDKWENTEGMSSQIEKINDEEALTMSSVLVCKKGGLIMPLTSGQGDRIPLIPPLFALRYAKAFFWAKGKGLGCQIFGCDPINMNTGNFIYEKEELIIPGITRMSFKIFYNSMDKGGGSIGKGWYHNHEMHIRKEGIGSLFLCQGDGKEIPYRALTGGLYVPVLGDKGMLAETKEGFRYVDGAGKEYVFSPEGWLLTRKDKNGNADIYTRDAGGRVASVKGANGGELLFTYNKEGYLIRVKDHTGREVRLWYRYGKLWKFVNPLGHAYIYEYNENGKLKSVQTPMGITGVQNEYDAEGRVLKQTMSDGSVVELRYDDANMRTYMMEPNGNLISYESDDRCRNLRTIYRDGEESYQYNDQNLRILYVDRNGNKTRYRYDEKGNLTGITNALGEQSEFTYDKEGRMLTAAAGGKKLVSNTYDERGRLTETADALGRSRKTSYDEKGLPVCLTQPDGSSFQIVRDERGNVVKITDPYGGETAYTYDGLNRVTSSTDAEGNTTSYQYDERNHLLQVTNPEGNTRSYVYNESGKPVQMEDYDGGILSIKYNTMGKPEKLTDKEGRETRRAYNEMGKLAEEITPSGAATSFVYDKNSRLARVEIRKGAKDEEAVSVAEYVYDPAGNLLKTRAGDGNKVLSESAYVYDALNRVAEVTDPAGGKTAYTYDKAGHISSITDPAGNRRTFTYNDAGELIEETDIRGNTTRYEYNALGQLTVVRDGIGRETRHFYMLGGRLERTVYPDGRQMAYTYDKLGKIKVKTDGQGNVLNYIYDCMGRVISVTSSIGQKKTYTYDALGNITSMTDANGNKTTYEYTLSGKLKMMMDALGNRTEYAYDSEDRLICICQKGKEGEESRKIFYQRNSFGQVECIQDAFGNEDYYRYDALGRIIVKTDRDGYQTDYGYAQDGKIKSIIYGDGTGVEMEYTALRQLALIKDWLGETKIKRNKVGDPIEITDHNGRSVSYEWGNMGERKGIVYPDGKKVSYHYDEMLRMQKMQIKRNDGLSESRVAGENKEIRYHYDEMGRMSEKLFPEEICTKWLYDKRGNLKELIHEDGHGMLDRYQYEYDLMGNKIAVTKERRGLCNESGRYEYGYDALCRLTTVSKDGDKLRKYTYDSFGNRSRLEDYERGENIFYHYDVMNRLIWMEERQNEYVSDRANGSLAENMPLSNRLRTDYVYDNRGNLIKEEIEGQLIHGYEYGAMNRLTKSWDENGKKAIYCYNGLGQRIRKSVSEDEEDYLLDLTREYHNLLEVYRGETSQCFYFDGNVAAMEETDRKRGISDYRGAFSRIHYYLQDELGSPLRVSGFRKGDLFIGEPGYLTYGYDEFGNDLERGKEQYTFPKFYDIQGKEQPFGYTGYRYDDICKTYFAQAREYQPCTGRFAARDIIKGNIAIDMTLNAYSYCWNNPLLLVDLNGLWPAWLEGIYAHLQFETEFMVMYGNWDAGNISKDFYGEVNVFIPGGGVKGGNGFADVILNKDDVAYIYEIKPESHHNDAAKQMAGQNQLDNYVAFHSLFIGKADIGNEIDIEPLLYMEEPFIFDTSRKIVYRMYPDSPGMIYYEFVEKGENEPEEQTAMSAQEEMVYERIKWEVEQMILHNPGIAAGMIEDPDSSDFFSALFSPEAIIKAILKNFMLPVSGSGGGSVTCPIL